MARRNWRLAQYCQVVSWYCTSARIDNLGTVLVNSTGTIDVAVANGSGNEGQGIKNAGTLTNNGTVILGSADLSKNGLLNTNSGTVVNNGLIDVQDINANGIRINGGTFDNFGTVTGTGPINGSFILTMGGIRSGPMDFQWPLLK